MPFASDTRAEFTSLFSLYVWVMIVTAAIVFAAVLFAAWRYRSRAGRVPSTRNEAGLFELVFALVLVAVGVVLVRRTFRTRDRACAGASPPQPPGGGAPLQWGGGCPFARPG